MKSERILPAKHAYLHIPSCKCNQGGGILKNFYKFLFSKKFTSTECLNSKKWLRHQFIPPNATAVYQVLNTIHLQGPKFNQSREQIKLDVKRTFPDVPYFTAGIGRKVLKRLLVAFAIYNPNLGYVQGMNFIAGTLLHHTSEINAFWLFVGLMDDYKLIDNFSLNLPGIARHCHATDFLLIEYLPNLHLHVSDKGITTPMVISD